MVKFETGTLSTDETEALLNSLPLDLTFVNAKDEVAYFSNSEKRVFPRAKSVIGLNVRNCHPKKSLDKVEQILKDFRNKGRDSAEFWIGMKGRLIYIRYFAVRGKKGEYLGCIEVTQDVTDIRKLKGEKRLL
jgi:hypothetical protein